MFAVSLQRRVLVRITVPSRTLGASTAETITMKRVFTLPDGGSAWGSVSVPLSVNLGEIGIMSPLADGEGIIFRGTPGSYDFAAHNAPREQVIVNLNAAVDITTTRDGMKRVEAGEAFFVEDVQGVGHVSKSVDAKPRHSLFLPVSKHSLLDIGCAFSDEPSRD